MYFVFKKWSQYLEFFDIMFFDIFIFISSIKYIFPKTHILNTVM